MIVCSALMSVFTMLPVLFSMVVAGNMVSAESIAAMHLCHPISEAYSTLTVFFCAGACLLSANAIGRNNSENANRYFTAALYASVSFMLLLSFVIFLFRNQIALSMCGGDLALYELIRKYLSLMAWEALPYCVFTLLSSFIVMDGTPVVPVIAAGIYSVLSTSLMVFACTAIGIEGVPLARLIGLICAVTGLLFYYLKGGCSFHAVNMRNSFLKYFRSNAVHGAEHVSSELIYIVSITVMNTVIMKVTGVEGTIIWGIIGSLSTLCIIYSTAVGSAACSLGPVMLGEGDVRAAKTLLRRSDTTIVLAVTVIFLIVELFPEQVMSLFGEHDDVRLDVADMRIAALLLFAPSLYASESNKFHILGQGMRGILYGSIFYLIPAVCMLVFSIFPVQYFRWSFPVALIVDTLCYSWVRREVDKLLENFTQEEQCMESSVPYDMSRITTEIDAIKQFLSEHDVPEDVAARLEHCIEELSYNIIKHRPEKIADKSYNIHLVRRSDGLEVFFKDAGRPFNPVLEFKDNAAEADAEGRKLMLALRLFNYYASEPSYRYMNGINMTRMYYRF